MLLKTLLRPTASRAPTFLGGPIVQTILGALDAERRGAAPELVTHVVRLADGDALAVSELGPATGTDGVLVVPGLGSTARAPNVLRLARSLKRLGVRVFLLNHRGSGDGRDLARGIYHAGRSEDVAAALGFVAAAVPGRVVVVAQSLGANMALRHLGRSRSKLEAALPEALAGIVAVAPVLALKDACRSIPSIALGLIDRQFIRSIRRYVDRRHRKYPDLGPVALPAKLTLPVFDELYTHREAGYATVDDYYRDASALPWLEHVDVPGVVLVAKDDPLRRFERMAWPRSFRLEETAGGGHLGGVTLTAQGAHGSRYWLDGRTCEAVRGLLSDVPR